MSETQHGSVINALREAKRKGPGPQSYAFDLKKIMARSSPRVQIGKQGRFDLIFQEKQWRRNPGPGAYNLREAQTTEQSPESKRSRNQKSRNTWSRSLR